jgi:catechol 2,3-dioxygenase-like lactoylglutathione lyase family enzyme
MKKKLLFATLLILAFSLGLGLQSFVQSRNGNPVNPHTMNEMKLGAFSMSLSVKDLNTSKEFYEKLGFTSFGGTAEHGYLIMKNGNALIGLFQGMFEGNILTFNPGWDENAQNMETYDDVRKIQKMLKDSDVKLITEADEQTTGPGSLMLMDPDGNMILIDQHR